MPSGRRLVRPSQAVLLLLLVIGAGCGNGKFGDFAGSSRTSTTRPGSGVTLAPDATAPTTAQATTTTPGGTPTTAAGPTTTVRASTVPAPPPPSQPVVTGARTDATASGLRSEPGCAGGRPVIRLSWEPVGTAEQAVAVSSRPDGLDSGNFTTSETLPATRATYELREAQPGGAYYWRVLTRRGTGWAASETAQFQGPLC